MLGCPSPHPYNPLPLPPQLHRQITDLTHTIGTLSNENVDVADVTGSPMFLLRRLVTTSVQATEVTASVFVLVVWRTIAPIKRSEYFRFSNGTFRTLTFSLLKLPDNQMKTPISSYHKRYSIRGTSVPFCILKCQRSNTLHQTCPTYLAEYSNRP